MKTPPPPKSLSREAGALWKKLLHELGEWEESQLLILRTGLEQWDVMQLARQRVKADGELVPDRFGQLRPHPLLAEIRQFASGVRATYKLLGLDLTEVE